MAIKTISFYNESQSHSDAVANTDRLVVEIGRDQIVCMAKNTATDGIAAFELFKLESEGQDWDAIFHELRENSKLVGTIYAETHIFYNWEESIIAPSQNMTLTVAEDYLALMFGESNQHDTRTDKISADTSLVNVYRERKDINDLLRQYFPLKQVHHSVTRLLEDVLTHRLKEAQFMKVQFYSNHLIVLLVKDHTLQLVRSFPFNATETILYHLLNVLQQYQLDAATIQLEISGMFDPGTNLHKQMEQLFGNLIFDDLRQGSIPGAALLQYPAHYFTPYFKLAV